MTFREEPWTFNCAGQRLLGIAALPDGEIQYGLIILVGGPQYRSGSHRQFTLLARYLASRGVATLRFDHRGLGDGEGEMRNFEDVEADLRSAIDTFLVKLPDLNRVNLWGLCDAASALLYYAPKDSRVGGLVLLNPWVHSPRSAGTTQLKHYYLKRLLQPSFWRKLLGGGVDIRASASGMKDAASAASGGVTRWDPRHGSPGYIERMLAGLRSCHMPILTILSGNDLVASEFRDLLKSQRSWRSAMGRKNVRTVGIPKADHTFSSGLLMGEVEKLTADWVLGESHGGGAARPVDG